MSALLLTLSLFACGEPACEHTYERRTVREATCDAEGLSKEICTKCEAEKEGSEAAIPKAEGHTSLGEFQPVSGDDAHHAKWCGTCEEYVEREEHSFDSLVCTVCDYSVLKLELTSDGSGYSVMGFDSFPEGVDTKSITLPSSYKGLPVLEIGEGAFGYLEEPLSGITLPEGLKKIGANALARCKFDTVTIPSSVTEIANSAFWSCTELKSVSFKDGSSLSSLGTGAFSDCYRLESIDLPDALTSIPSKCFERCLELSKIDLPDSLGYIGEYAFSDSGLRHLYLPDSVTEIGAWAFNCKALLSVRLGSQLTTLGDSSFKAYDIIEVCNDSSLTVYPSLETDGLIEFGGISGAAEHVYSTASGESKLKKLDNGFVTYTSSGKTYLVEYTGDESEITVPEDYVLWSCAFYNNDTVTKVVFRDGTKACSLDYLFWGCDALESFEFPSTISNGLSSTGSVITTLGEGMFGNCGSLTNLVIPALYYDEYSMDYEGLDNMFFGAESTLVITYGGSECRWASMGGYCYGATVICDTAFEYELSEDGSYYAVIGIGTITETDRLVFPRTHLGLPVKAIGKEAFKDVNRVLNIKEVVLHNGITEIGEGAFYANYSLTEVAMEGVKNIGKSAFSSCTSLVDVEINGALTTVGDSAFNNCTALSSISLPDSLTEIGNAAFAWCSELASMDLSLNTKLKKIGNNAFERCTKLEEVVLPSVLESLGFGAFSYTSLKGIAIPAAITVLEEDLFKGCTALKEVSFAEESSLTKISGGVFSSCSMLTSITLPEGVTEIGNAFYDCVTLSEVNLPKSATTLGGYAGCTSLTRIYIPEGVTKIEPSAFRNCTQLEEVIIGAKSKLTSIGGGAFEGCEALTRVYFGGTQTVWEAILSHAETSSFNNTALTTATVYYYSESTPTDSGSFWHFDADGVTPVLW